MAKESRRSKKQKQPRLSAAQMVQPGTEGQRSTASNGAKIDKATVVNLKEEYHYVVTDLKRIAGLAAAMLVILVVLAVILT